jgi:hypothetical protein
MNLMEPLSKDALQKIAADGKVARTKQIVTAFCSSARESVLCAAKNGNESISIEMNEDASYLILEIQAALTQLFPDCSIGWAIPARTVMISWS